MRSQRWRAHFSTVLALASLALAPRAEAGDHYWEFGGGMASATGTNAFLGGGSAPDSLSGVPYLQAAIAPCIYHGFARFYLGAHLRMHLFEGGSLTPLYPYAELGLWRFYFAAGYSPYVMTGLSKVEGAKALLLHGGFILPITPEISLNLVLGQESVTLTGGVQSPKSVTTFGLNFRLYFGGGPLISSSGGGGNFRGYRYPMGYQR